ncbi:hypothetical protein [Nonomuraea sp. NPDC048916]|uniref:hypothetical protein n=1 Tax=Nonomuraea sp. NPDC048916 TaxID=3154232 RepID=UPI0033E0012D
MSTKRQDEALPELAAAIRDIDVPGELAISNVIVEPYRDSADEAALRAIVVMNGADADGWSAELTHTLGTQANRLAAERGLDDYVYVSVFSEQEYSERGNDSLEVDNDTDEVDRLLAEEPQGDQ